MLVTVLYSVLDMVGTNVVAPPVHVSVGAATAANWKALPSAEPVMVVVAVLVQPVEVVVPVTVYTVVTVGLAATLAVVDEESPDDGLQR